MSKVCSVCDRGPRVVIKRSKSHIANRTKQNLNLQTRNLAGKRVKVCTRCLRAQTKASKS